MGKNENMVLTSVKIPNELFEEFKVSCVRYKFSIQKLTERAMYLYLTDGEFKKQMHSQLNTFYTGSK
jgi:hypothetical protein